MQHRDSIILKKVFSEISVAFGQHRTVAKE